MKTYLRFLGIALFLTGTAGEVCAQFGYYNEALLFSRTQNFGTARISGIGGTQVALGGDISLAASNPAGLGFFNRSSFSFSPGMDFSSANSEFFDNSVKAYRNKFIIPEVGLVLNNSKGNVLPDDFKGSSVAVSLQRTNNFNHDIQYVGINSSSSIVNAFIWNASNRFPDQLGGFEGIAYDHFLIDEADYNTDDPFFFNAQNGITYISPNIEDGTVEGYESVLGNYYGSLPQQTERITTSGGQYALNTSWGGNFKDVFYFGAGLGIHFIEYDRVRRYTESEFQLPDGSPDNLVNSISIRDRLSIEGSGLNATLGAILRPLPFLTAGISYHTPTFYALNEDSDFIFETQWGENLSYAFNGDTLEMGVISTESDIFVSDYALKTPAKLNMGAALFLGKKGFISGEVELIDFSTAQLQSSDFEVFDDNDAIVDFFRNVINYKLGAELRFDELRVRGGFNYQADPFQEQLIDRSIYTYSGGLGYKSRDLFVDITARVMNTQQTYSPYFLPEDYAGGSPVVHSDLQKVSAMITFGTTF
ncbi:MAG: hypothetical protein ACO2ZZ_05600 [Cyclobacteriaceae bacterium]